MKTLRILIALFFFQNGLSFCSESDKSNPVLLKCYLAPYSPLKEKKAKSSRSAKVSTGRGDKGSTDLLKGGRISKNSPPIHLVGLLDELNVYIGMAKINSEVDPDTAEQLQKDIQVISAKIVSIEPGKELILDPGILNRLDQYKRLKSTPEILGLIKEIHYYLSLMEQDFFPDTLLKYMKGLVTAFNPEGDKSLRGISATELLIMAESLSVKNNPMEMIVALLKKISQDEGIAEKELQDFESLYATFSNTVELGKEFILSGGNSLSVQYDLFRVKVREYERKKAFITDPITYQFINRLSDFLFFSMVKAREEKKNKEESGIPSATIKRTAEILSGQTANVVFEKNKQKGAWIFRRGPVDLEMDPAFCNELGSLFEAQGHESLLMAMRGWDPAALEKLLNKVLTEEGDLAEELNSIGIHASYEFKKILMVAPYGDMEGNALRYAVPHMGVEILANRVLRETENADALVYNPNLGSIEGLYEFVKQNHFDVIGVSILQTVLKANLEILGQLSLLSPDSLFVAGGTELKRFPREEVFESWPLDIMSYDSGSSLVQVLKMIDPKGSRSGNLKNCEGIPNLAIHAGDKTVIVTPTQKEELHMLNDIYGEVSFDKADLVHGKHYESKQDTKDPVAFDRIGRNPTRIPFGDYCKGRCIFCGTKRNTRRNLAPEKVVQMIASADPKSDSVHFESADFLYDVPGLDPLLQELAGKKDIRRVPKLAIARVDEIGDGKVIHKMAEAGFKIIAFGIESFDDRVLKNIGKDTNAEANHTALNYCIENGIKPGLNLILFTPWDTVQTILQTIDYSLSYMEKGAYINVVPYLFSGYGRPLTRMTEVVDYESFDFPGLKKTFKFPGFAKILDPRLAELRKQVSKKMALLEAENNYPEWAKRSVNIYSLSVYKAFLLALKEDSSTKTDEIDERIARVDQAIARVIRSEASTLMEKEEPAASGVLEALFNPFNKLLTSTILQTEDGRKIKLRFHDDYPDYYEGCKLPATLIYNIYELNEKGEENYRGWVRLNNNLLDEIEGYKVEFGKIRRADVFIYRAIEDLFEKVIDDPSLLLDDEADYQKTGPGLVPHYYRLPSEPLFGEYAPKAVYENATQEEFLSQIRATYDQGYTALGEALMEYLPKAMNTPAKPSRFILPPGWEKETVHHPYPLLRPDLAVSDMDLTRFPEDASAKQVMTELAETALKYKSAAVSIYPKHLDFLPVEDLKKEGIHVGVVVAFPQGLAHCDMDQELKALEEAMKKGADEVDLVMDFEAILQGNPAQAEKSLAKMALGIENLKWKYKKPMRIKTILEVSALKTEKNIREAASIALKYSDMIKMVSGFPVKADQNNKGRATLIAGKIMLEEILYYYQQTGILRAMKITGGINEWDDPEQPDRSAKKYYELVLKVFGNSLGAHFLFERDLFRVGGYGSLPDFLKVIQEDDISYTSEKVPFNPEDYPYLKIPSSKEESSLNIEDYLSGKFPPELLENIKARKGSIELHQGSVTATKAYLHNLTLRGYKVTELFPPNALPYRFYKIVKGEEEFYAIAGLIGEARELFMLQALSQFYQYPEEKLYLRKFEEGGIRALLQKGLAPYAGKVDQAVILHEIDQYVRVIKEDPALGIEVADRIKTDYVDAVILKKKDGKLVLLFEMQYANGSHIRPVVEYLASPVSKGGAGIPDITLHGACGGIGDTVRVNDLIVYSDIYWNGKKMENMPPNDINAKKLSGLLPEGVEAHSIPIYDIPTVLNSSIPEMKKIYARGSGGLELELAHAAKAAHQFPDVKFRAFYEVHDKPATEKDKKDQALSKKVPGLMNLEKRYKIWKTLSRYLFESDEPSAEEKTKKLPSKLNQAIEELKASSSTSPALIEESRQHAMKTINRIIVQSNQSNVVFLGQGEGLHYYGNMKSELDQARIESYYWDAKEHLNSLNKPLSIDALLPGAFYMDLDSPGGKFQGKILFIDHMDYLLKDKKLREDVLDILRHSDVRIVGYMPAAEYATVEKAFFETEESNACKDFGVLNFELTRENNPAKHHKKVVVLGASGLVGRKIMTELKEQGFMNISGVSLHGDPDRKIQAADLTDPAKLKELIQDADYVINAAVDLNFSRMEKDGPEREKARAVNVGIPETIKALGYRGKLIQLSSFYVFGHQNLMAHTESRTAPLSVYGQQKAAAEQVVKQMQDYAIVRLGPLFGFDSLRRQKGFYEKVVNQLDQKAKGLSTEEINAPDYPVSPVISVKQVAQGIVSLLEKDFSGVAQLSGRERLNAVEQVRRISKIYNQKSGTKVKLNVRSETVRKETSLTPDVAMFSMISPDIEEGISDLIEESHLSENLKTEHPDKISLDKYQLPRQRFGSNPVNFMKVFLEVLSDELGTPPLVSVLGSTPYLLTKEGDLDWDKISDIDLGIYLETPLPEEKKIILMLKYFEKLKQLNIRTNMPAKASSQEINPEDLDWGILDQSNEKRLRFHFQFLSPDQLFSSGVSGDQTFSSETPFYGDMDRLKKYLKAAGFEKNSGHSRKNSLPSLPARSSASERSA